MLLMGYAYQKGLIPLKESSIEAAIELNGVSVEFNKQAFLWGRRTAHDYNRVRALVEKHIPTFTPLKNIDDIIQWRIDYLKNYQNQNYADEYSHFVDQVRSFEDRTKLSRDYRCLLYTSPSPRDLSTSRMPSSA